MLATEMQYINRSFSRGFPGLKVYGYHGENRTYIDVQFSRTKKVPTNSSFSFSFSVFFFSGELKRFPDVVSLKVFLQFLTELLNPSPVCVRFSYYIC